MNFKRYPFLLVGLLILGLLWGVTGAASAQAGAEAGFFEDLEVPPGQRFEVPVEVRDVTDLYAIDIEIRFDPAILQVEDANPDVDGVQPALGTFLDAGLTLFNTVDNETGLVRFAMSQVNPAEPKSGDGIVLVLYFTALAEGESELEISLLEASDRFGNEVVLEPVEAQVRVAAGAPEIVATAIPVQDQEGLILVPTLAPTPVPTQETLITAEPTPGIETDPAEAEAYPAVIGVEPELEAAYPAAEAEPVEAERADSILDYWWAVLIVVLVAGGLGAYLWLGKQRAGR
jgi:hypothetical protein